MDLSPYYIEELEQRGRTKVFLVHGELIRKDLDGEFTNFGTHVDYKFIPEGEIWIDDDVDDRDLPFFIGRAMAFLRYLRQGEDRKSAYDHAARYERRERKRAMRYTGEKKAGKGSDVHIRMLKELPNGVQVWLVDGKRVRDAFDVDFTEGGHDYAYTYVPKKEIWLEPEIGEDEFDFVLLHELYERRLMDERKLEYLEAHRRASKLEWSYRNKESKDSVKEALRAEGWQ